MLTQSRLKQLLHYNQKTGSFTWRFHAWCSGKRAGSKDSYGHIQICVDGQRYAAHRLAWFYMYGRWPRRSLDHEDRDRSNNAWNNLRPASASQNNANRRTRRGPLKCIQYRGNGRWRVRIEKDGNRNYYKSTHTNLKEAKEVCNKILTKIYGPYAFLE